MPMHGELPIRFNELLDARETLQRQASLANLAFAFETLREFARRIARARLKGEVNLKSADPDADRYWATLTAVDGKQSLIEEHFTEEDLTDFADAISFATGHNDFEATFSIQDFPQAFLAPLRSALEQSGIVMDDETQPTEKPRSKLR
jgi:hypothetical protein